MRPPRLLPLEKQGVGNREWGIENSGQLSVISSPPWPAGTDAGASTWILQKARTKATAGPSTPSAALRSLRMTDHDDADFRLGPLAPIGCSPASPLRLHLSRTEQSLHPLDRILSVNRHLSLHCFDARRPFPFKNLRLSIHVPAMCLPCTSPCTSQP
jgi:hypothetical protein